MQRGELDIVNFDRAVLDCLGADFLPNEAAQQTGPNYSPDDDALGFGIDGRDAGDDPSCAVIRPQRQAEVPGVTGTGIDGRVGIVFNAPEDQFNRYIVPGIRVMRSGMDIDDNRRMSRYGGIKYRVPSDNGYEVTVSGRRGHSAYVERHHAEPMIFMYEIEARARLQREAQLLRRYISRKLKDQSFLPVYDSKDVVSYFNVFRESISDMTEYVDSLNRHHSYILSYRIQAQIDDHEEYEERALISEPHLNVSQIK